MPAEVRLTVKELDDLIAEIEAKGGDSSELRKLRAQVAEEKGLKKAEAKPLGEEELIAQLRSQSTIERGTDLECLVCRNRVDELLNGVCEACFRNWALTVKRR